MLNLLLTKSNAYFLDCGANIGYWSVIASTILSPGRTLALEASPPQFDQLRRNALLNDGKYEPIFGAIWSRTGEPLVIVTHDRRHAGASVVNRREKAGQPGHHASRIESVTIDSVCDTYISSPDAKIVVKLPVDDAEIPALEGARNTLVRKKWSFYTKITAKIRPAELATTLLKISSLMSSIVTQRIPLSAWLRLLT